MNGQSVSRKEWLKSRVFNIGTTYQRLNRHEVICCGQPTIHQICVSCIKYKPAHNAYCWNTSETMKKEIQNSYPSHTHVYIWNVSHTYRSKKWENWSLNDKTVLSLFCSTLFLGEHFVRHMLLVHGMNGFTSARTYATFRLRDYQPVTFLPCSLLTAGFLCSIALRIIREMIKVLRYKIQFYIYTNEDMYPWICIRASHTASSTTTVNFSKQVYPFTALTARRWFQINFQSPGFHRRVSGESSSCYIFMRRRRRRLSRLQ